MYETNLAEPLYRGAQIREVERVVIEELQIPGVRLMFSAGQTAFADLQRRWPELRCLTVYCGLGNNGGDGYVVARLALQAGYRVKVYAIDHVSALKGDALNAGQTFLQAGGVVEKLFTGQTPPTEGLIVDALLGTGLNRQIGSDYQAAIELINSSACPVMAVDIPSGLHADTGCVMGCAVKADVTVTFIGLKCGLFTGEAADFCGRIVLADLSVPKAVFANIKPAAHLLKKHVLPVRSRCAHKGKFGHVLLLGGNLGYSGAIRLAGEAALRSGAGLVSIGSRAAHIAFLNIGRPELMCHAVEDTSDLMPLLAKAGVVVIGPGLGQDVWAESLFAAALASHKPLVVDADALNLLAQQPQKYENWILTPHPGEAARLLACRTEDIAADRYAAITALQQDYGGICLLKGAGSLISDGKEIFVSTTGNPGMASGGMGDVLSGIVGSLLAQSCTPLDALKLGVYVHGQAADRSATSFGERGLLASDLFDELRYCLNTPF